MRGTHAIAAVATLVVFALAGCVSEGAAKSSEPETAPRDLAPPSSDEGQIVGMVTDDALTPLAGVMVAVIEANPALQQLTNEAGQFGFDGLAPGKYTVAAQKLGYESGAKAVDVAAGEAVEVSFALAPIPVGKEPRYQTLIGQGYFSCGAWLYVITWGNLHACVWDDHKPRYVFNVPKEGIMGIMQEITWQRNTGLTSEYLIASIQYKPVCTPFCSYEQSWGGGQGRDPIRKYIEFDTAIKKVKEEPAQLASMTFPGGEGPSTNPPSAGTGPVIVFQQRMTHYITLFYWAHSDTTAFTALPDK